MLDVAFIYGYEKANWEKCTDPKYFEKDIEDTPCVTLVEYTGYNFRRHLNTDYVFCPKHNAMEYILDISDNRVVSDKGCCLEGILGFAKINGGYMGCFDNKPVFAPFRWRVFQGDSYQAVNIACDVMRVKDDVNGILTRWINYSLSVDFVSEKYVISQIKQKDDTYINWTDTDIEIPDVVVETAIEIMRESTLYATGIKPSVLCQIKNKYTVLGYMERPFDPNIVFLKTFFKYFLSRDSYYIFDEIFSREEKNNYKVMCDLLEIKPPKSLRKAYAFNLYAIVWYMIFKQWGIKDINYMHKFFYLDECIASIVFYGPEIKNRPSYDLREMPVVEIYSERHDSTYRFTMARNIGWLMAFANEEFGLNPVELTEKWLLSKTAYDVYRYGHSVKEKYNKFTRSIDVPVRINDPQDTDFKNDIFQEIMQVLWNAAEVENNDE